MNSLFHRTATVAAVLSCLALAVEPALATDPSSTPATTKTTVHKKKPAANSSDLEQYRSSDFKGEYPGDCARMRSVGVCMIDLGYGRCVPCDAGPFK